MASVQEFLIRKAVVPDIPALHILIEQSVRHLQKDDYTPEQIEGALGHTLGLDTQLIEDGTYFVAEPTGSAGVLAGCGGWSNRKTLFGSDHGPNRETPPPDAKPAFAAFQPAVLYPKYLEAIRGHKRRALQAGDTLNIGSLLLTVVTSDGVTIKRALPGSGGAIDECASMNSMDKDGGEENARSVGVVLTFGRSRIASFGDLTWDVEKKLVCPRDKVGPVDLFFVSNHGSNLNNSPALLHALAPRIAIVGNGAKKGADIESYETVSGSPRLVRFWQLHFAERADAQHNVPEAYIANPRSEGDTHASLEVSVSKQGAFTVTNDRTGLSESYPPVAGATVVR